MSVNELPSVNRVHGFYKGILPPILAETPKRAVKVNAVLEYRLVMCTTYTNIDTDVSSLQQSVVFHLKHAGSNTSFLGLFILTLYICYGPSVLTYMPSSASRASQIILLEESYL